jgi:hypothetical protein
VTREEQEYLVKTMKTMTEVNANLAHLTAELKALRRVAVLAEQLIEHDPVGTTYRDHKSDEAIRAALVEALRFAKAAADDWKAA